MPAVEEFFSARTRHLDLDSCPGRRSLRDKCGNLYFFLAFVAGDPVDSALQLGIGEGRGFRIHDWDWVRPLFDRAMLGDAAVVFSKE